MTEEDIRQGDDELQLDGLKSAENRVFEVAVQYLAIASRRTESVSTVLHAAIRRLDESSIGARERDRRVKYLLDQIAPDEEALSVLAQLAQVEGMRSKNAIMLCLPPHLRQSLYKSDITKRDLATIKPAPPVDQTQKLPPSKSTHESDNHSENRAVLLLGTDDEHAANIALLRSHNFATMRCQTDEQLAPVLETPLCGIVVGGSWWKQFPSGVHPDALRRIGSISSFLWIRIDTDNLETSACHALPTIQREICVGSRSVFSHASGCRITEADIGAFSHAAGLFTASEASRFHPSEINADESLLLRAAATAHVRGHQQDANAKLQVLGTSFFKSGRSQAKIVLVQPDDEGAAFVVKLGKLDDLRDEMTRFRSHIDRWDNRTQPELHFHAGMGAIVFTLIDATDAPGSPAPTLHDRLEKMINSELGSWGEAPPSEDDLKKAIERVVAKLGTLNRRKQQANVDNYGWIAGSVANVGSGTVKWAISGTGGNSLDIPALAQSAFTRVHALDGRATVHGDVHLHNILVSDDRDPYLIDYAYTGPGHPCFDLVRLNASVIYRAFRMLESEESVAALLRAVYVDGHEYARLEQTFPSLLSAVGNRLSIRTGIAIRKASLEVLQDYSGNLEDYLAMELLVACQALTMIEPQAGIARAMIRALSEIRL